MVRENLSCLGPVPDLVLKPAAEMENFSLVEHCQALSGECSALSRAGSSMQAPGRRKAVKSCQAGAGKAGEDGLGWRRQWQNPYLNQKGVAPSSSAEPAQVKAATVTCREQLQQLLQMLREKCLASKRCCSQDTSGQYILKMCQICLKYSCMLPVIYRNNHSSIIILLLLPVKNLISWR